MTAKPPIDTARLRELLAVAKKPRDARITPGTEAHYDWRANREKVWGELLAGINAQADHITTLEAENASSIAGVWAQAESNHREHSDTGDRENDIRFLTLGLTGEAGEIMEAILDAALVVQASGNVANLVKKRWRDGDGHDDAIQKEIADVCAYAFMLANTMGMTPAGLIQTIADKQAVFVAKMRARSLSTQGTTDKGDAS